MADHDILFSASMVLAILAGLKTQTCRAITPGRSKAHGWPSAAAAWSHLDLEHARAGRLTFADLSVLVVPHRDHPDDGAVMVFPRWQPGDRLHVRERYAFPASMDAQSPAEIASQCTEAGYLRPWCPTWYDAGAAVPSTEGLGLELKARGRWRSSINLPRWASRITLKVVSVRPEHLTEISEADATAEGCSAAREFVDPATGQPSARAHFAALWYDINGNKQGHAWADDPWCWVTSFEPTRRASTLLPN